MLKGILKKDLLALYDQADDFLRSQFQRSLSFQDSLFDRWERAKKLGFSEGVSVYNSALIYGDVIIGEKTWVGPYVILDGSGGGLKIGAFCSIAAGTHIYTHDSIKWSLSGGQEEIFKAYVSIGDNVYIGAQSIVRAGVSIGNSCIVGAGSFVSTDVEDFSIVAGSPAATIGRVKSDESGVSLQYFENDSQ